MADFDPKAYLKDKLSSDESINDMSNQQAPTPSSSFDSTSYVNNLISQSKPDANVMPQTSTAGAFGLGALQGGTLGYADEIEGALKSAASNEMADLAKDFISGHEDPKKYEEEKQKVINKYAELRDKARSKYALAEQQHGTFFGLGSLTGALGAGAGAAVLAPSIVGAGVLGNIAAQGVLGGAAALGQSNADLTKGQTEQALGDVKTGGLIGAGLGAVGSGIGALVGKGMGQGFNYAAKTGNVGEIAINKDLQQLAAQKGQLLDKAAQAGQEVNITPLQDELEQGLAKLPYSKNEAEDTARNALLDAYKRATDVGGKGELSSLAPNDLDAFRKALASITKDRNLSDTDAANLAKRLLGKTSELENSQVNGLSSINKSLQEGNEQLGDAGSKFHVNPLHPISSTITSAIKAGVQAPQTTGRVLGAISKALGVTPLVEAATEAAKVTGSTIPQTINPNDIKNTDVSKLSRNFYDMPMPELQKYIPNLEGTQFSHQGEALQKAIEENDSMAKDRALFVLMQNPRSRELLKEPKDASVSDKFKKLFNP